MSVCLRPANFICYMSMRVCVCVGVGGMLHVCVGEDAMCVCVCRGGGGG